MVFRAANTRVYKLRVTDNAGHSATLSTGTDDESVAEDVERMVKGFRSQRKWAYLTLLATKRAKLALVYDAFVSGTLDAYMTALLAEASDVDLSPLVEEWAKRAKPKYVAQVRVLIVAGKRFPRSEFRKARISSFLASLNVAEPTRNRYRAALSVFAKWIVEREVIETNPVRDVAAFKENNPRDQWMTWAEVQRVARFAAEPYRTLILVMAGTGIEVSAAARLTVYDVDEKAGTIHAKGSKTEWRNRVVRAEPFVWTALKAHTLRGMAGELFPNVNPNTTRDHFKAAQKKAKVGRVQRLHDLRHTYAVNALRSGLRPEVVAHQLGHKDATLVARVYGRYVPNAEDYVRQSPLTAPATSSRKRMKRNA